MVENELCRVGVDTKIGIKGDDDMFKDFEVPTLWSCTGSAQNHSPHWTHS